MKLHFVLVRFECDSRTRFLWFTIGIVGLECVSNFRQILRANVSVAFVIPIRTAASVKKKKRIKLNVPSE